MKSPFPGMDPYLEPHWPGLHTQLVALASAELNRLLPDDLVARRNAWRSRTATRQPGRWSRT